MWKFLHNEILKDTMANKKSMWIQLAKIKKENKLKLKWCIIKLHIKQIYQYTPWFAIDKDDYFLSYSFIINGEARLKLLK
jgi:hypothetical protein